MSVGDISGAPESAPENVSTPETERRAVFATKYESVSDELYALRAGVDKALPDLIALIERVLDVLGEAPLTRVTELVVADRTRHVAGRRDDVRARMDLVARAIKLGLSEDAALQVLFSVYESTPIPASGLLDKLQAFVAQRLTVSAAPPAAASPCGCAQAHANANLGDLANLYGGVWPSPSTAPSLSELTMNYASNFGASDVPSESTITLGVKESTPASVPEPLAESE